jgi:hypothetical protein
VSRPLTSDEAFALQSQVVEQVAGQRSSWVALAGRLADFHAGKGWSALAMDSFNEWLGQPEISLARAEAYAMISAWRELVVEREVDVEHLARLDVSKIAVVLPAIKDGRVDLDQALSDCEVLSRSDLRAQYQSADAASYRLCEACGQRVKVASGAA